MQKTLFIVGAVCIAAALLWPGIAKLGLGRLPGDLAIERENVRVYAPITTSIVISIAVTLVLWLLRR